MPLKKRRVLAHRAMNFSPWLETNTCAMFIIALPSQHPAPSAPVL